MWPAGPAWFLWQLFLLSALTAGLHALAPQGVKALARLGGSVADRPLAFFLSLTMLSTLAYVPLAIAFTPWDWTYWGPFSSQLSRPLHYVVYFLAGFSMGAYGCDRGMLCPDGPLARHWRLWLAAAVASFAIWGGVTSQTLSGWDTSPLAYQLAAAFAFPPACASGALFLLAICLRLLQIRDRLLDSLSRNAYGIYLVHYVFVVWLQYALFSVPLNAILKYAVVFAAALVLSWAASSGLGALNPRHLGLLAKRAVADQSR